jgi:hypothetical protein
MLSVLLTLLYLIIIWLFAAGVINITAGSSIHESLNHKRNTNNNVIPQDKHAFEWPVKMNNPNLILAIYKT